jgi:hypothetical protein
MKILEQVRERIKDDLPQCKTHDDVQQLFDRGQLELNQSKAPFGQRQQMWLDIKEHLSTLSRRPQVINDAHTIIDVILKRLTA